MIWMGTIQVSNSEWRVGGEEVAAIVVEFKRSPTWWGRLTRRLDEQSLIHRATNPKHLSTSRLAERIAEKLAVETTSHPIVLFP